MNDADVAFRQGQFVVAETEYRRVVKRSRDWGSRGLPHGELAGRMRELSSQAEKVNASLKKKTELLDEDAFDELSRTLTELLGDQPVPSPGAESGENGEDGSPVGLDFTVSGRVSELLDGWLVGRARRMSDRVAAAKTVQQVSVKRLFQLPASPPAPAQPPPRPRLPWAAGTPMIRTRSTNFFANSRSATVASKLGTGNIFLPQRALPPIFRPLFQDPA